MDVVLYTALLFIAVSLFGIESTLKKILEKMK